jgi:AcrR family transcriptional regulator
MKRSFISGENGLPRSESANQHVREQTRKRILDAAMSVFARSGSRSTMADIAAEAGVSQGLAYRYFPSKEAILTRLVEEAAKSGGGPAARVRRLTGSPGERLARLISSILEDRRERPEFYRFLYQVMRDESIAPGLKEMVLKSGSVILGEIRRMIVDGQATGEIARDDPDQLIAALMSLVEGLVTWVPSAKSKARFPDARIVLRLLRPDTPVGQANNR